MTNRAERPARTCDAALHELMVKTIKGLVIDGVETAKSGHPGMPMGTADMATALWLRFLSHDPSAPHWPDRDRFVLSAGHGSMLLYSLLHLTGYDLPMSELQQFRRLHSRTPGHPEFNHTVGVEVTTGPLGTGFAAAVGMACAERILAHRYNQPGHTVVDHFVYGICSDGDLMEGVASEAASLAGHLGLGKLVFLYDSNRITIDGSTELAFSEDVRARFAAYGWHVQYCDGHDGEAVSAAIAAARAVPDKPSLIECRTIIGRGAPTKQGTSGSHGSPLGTAEAEAAKKGMDWPLEPKFYVPDELRHALAERREQLAAEHAKWTASFEGYRAAHPELAAEFEALQRGELPPGTLDAIPQFEPGKPIATRKAQQKVLEALLDAHPMLVGGSADLGESNGVNITRLPTQSKATPGGRIFHFGVREHGMGGVCNGIAAHGGLRVYDATFLVFSDFMRGCVRLSALMKLPIIHVFSHDSIWLGEDGPTHQPIEQCMALRLIPDLDVVRPADARETAAAWRHALTRKLGDGPTAVLVTRQNLPVFEESRDDISCGAYVLWDPPGVAASELHGILIATGSEVALAYDAAKQLHAAGTPVRVVSMPCWEAFTRQDDAWREQVLPAAIDRRLSIEAGTTFGWQRWAKYSHGIDHYGASAPGEDVAKEFGFTVDALVGKYRSLP
ncbi:MAG: transketolase [Deltaproteobacteria bacterium]|nr:transketolase [Nannocystaceae bacterium]